MQYCNIATRHVPRSWWSARKSPTGAHEDRLHRGNKRKTCLFFVVPPIFTIFVTENDIGYAIPEEHPQEIPRPAACRQLRAMVRRRPACGIAACRQPRARRPRTNGKAANQLPRAMVRRRSACGIAASRLPRARRPRTNGKAVCRQLRAR